MPIKKAMQAKTEADEVAAEAAARLERARVAAREAADEAVRAAGQKAKEDKKAAQEALLRRAKANSDAQLGKFVPSEEDKKAIESTYQKNYSCAPRRAAPAVARGPRARLPRASLTRASLCAPQLLDCLPYAAGERLAHWPAVMA